MKTAIKYIANIEKNNRFFMNLLLYPTTFPLSLRGKKDLFRNFVYESGLTSPSIGLSPTRSCVFLGTLGMKKRTPIDVRHWFQTTKTPTFQLNPPEFYDRDIHEKGKSN